MLRGARARVGLDGRHSRRPTLAAVPGQRRQPRLVVRVPVALWPTPRRRCPSRASWPPCWPRPGPAQRVIRVLNDLASYRARPGLGRPEPAAADLDRDSRPRCRRADRRAARPRRPAARATTAAWPTSCTGRWSFCRGFYGSHRLLGPACEPAGTAADVPAAPRRRPAHAWSTGPADREPWGQVSPSVYETGRLVVLAPSLTGHAERLDFLRATQRADGGWGAGRRLRAGPDAQRDRSPAASAAPGRRAIAGHPRGPRPPAAGRVGLVALAAHGCPTADRAGPARHAGHRDHRAGPDRAINELPRRLATPRPLAAARPGRLRGLSDEAARWSAARLAGRRGRSSQAAACPGGGRDGRRRAAAVRADRDRHDRCLPGRDRRLARRRARSAGPPGLGLPRGDRAPHPAPAGRSVRHPDHRVRTGLGAGQRSPGPASTSGRPPAALAEPGQARSARPARPPAAGLPAGRRHHRGHAVRTRADRRAAGRRRLACGATRPSTHFCTWQGEDGVVDDGQRARARGARLAAAGPTAGALGTGRGGQGGRLAVAASSSPTAAGTTGGTPRPTTPRRLRGRAGRLRPGGRTPAGRAAGRCARAGRLGARPASARDGSWGRVDRHRGGDRVRRADPARRRRSRPPIVPALRPRLTYLVGHVFPEPIRLMTIIDRRGRIPGPALWHDKDLYAPAAIVTAAALAAIHQARGHLATVRPRSSVDRCRGGPYRVVLLTCSMPSVTRTQATQRVRYGGRGG